MTGKYQKWNSSTRPCSTRVLSSSPVPYLRMFLPGCSLSFATSSATSPWMTEAFQVVSVSVREATYLGMAFMASAAGPSIDPQATANPS